jgi:transcriptional regulator of heat shock response
MSDALTARQAQILKSLIDEYIETAEPVGSEVLEKKYSLGVSSATIRNEMVSLTNSGYLRQPHTSAGRVPSPKAMKFYIDQLMEEKQMPLTEEVKAKEEVWDVRSDLDKLMSEATQALAARTRNLSVGVLDDGKTWHAGMANVFANPEFTDLSTCANVFSFIEETNRLIELFFRRMEYVSPVEVLFGEELNWPELEPVSVVATHFSLGNRQGALGVIGPARLSYPTVIPVLRYFGKLMEEVART